MAEQPGDMRRVRNAVRAGQVPRPKQATFTGQQYGQATAQRRAQQQVPTGPAPTDAAPAIVPLNAPSQRPTEPVTAGSLTGPGPGPEALAPAGITPGSRQDLVLRVRAMVSRYPNPNLVRILQALEQSAE